MGLTPFLYLDPSDAVQYVVRWRPQTIAGQVVSATGVNAYARARIQLRDPKCVGMLVNIRNTAYVLHKTNETTYAIACCLWPRGSPSLEEFRALREWCDTMLPVSPDAHLLDDDVERELWDLSIFDG